MLKKISKIFGKGVSHAINSSIYLKKEITGAVVEGYRQTRKSRCCWCHGYFPTDSLETYMVKSKSYKLCDYCLEGLGAVEVQMPEVYKKHRDDIINFILHRAEIKTKNYTGFNNFIDEANEAIKILRL